MWIGHYKHVLLLLLLLVVVVVVVVVVLPDLWSGSSCNPRDHSLEFTL